MTEQWKELKETIIEMRDNGGVGTQQVVCKFLVNYMEVLEKQMQQPCEDMRDATEEERKSTKDYIDSISKPTGLRFDDLYEEIDFVQSHKKIPCTITIGKPCEDCVSRAEVYDIITRLFTSVEMTHEQYKEVMQLVKELPSVTSQQTRWIPCSERLPDDDEDYLVIDDKGECGVGYYRHTANAWDSTNFGWLEGIDRVDDYLDMPCGLSKVIAWMPLPQLYKAKSEEKE